MNYIYFLFFADGGGLHQQRHHRLRRHQHQQQVQQPRKDWSPSRDAYSGGTTTAMDSSASSSLPVSGPSVFVSANATVVRAHAGSTAVLDCRVRKDSQYGMVSNTLFTSHESLNVQKRSFGISFQNLFLVLFRLHK